MIESKESLKLREIFLRLARLFTTHPDEMKVEVNHSGDLITMSCHSHCEDSAKLIGGGASTFRAMISILNLAAMKMNHRFYLSRIKDIRGTVMPSCPPGFKRNGNWPQMEIMKAFQQTCEDILHLPFEAEYAHVQRISSFINLTVEPAEPIDENHLEDAMTILFLAISRSNGHQIKVLVEKKGSLNHETNLASSTRR